MRSWSLHNGQFVAASRVTDPAGVVKLGCIRSIAGRPATARRRHRDGGLGDGTGAPITADQHCRSRRSVARRYNRSCDWPRCQLGRLKPWISITVLRRRGSHCRSLQSRGAAGGLGRHGWSGADRRYIRPSLRHVQRPEHADRWDRMARGWSGRVGDDTRWHTHLARRWDNRPLRNARLRKVAPMRLRGIPQRSGY